MKRLHRALLRSSEMKAFIVLIIALGLCFWRTLQFKYQLLPNIIQIIEIIRARVLSSRLFNRRRIHWVGFPLSSRSISIRDRERAGAALSLSKR